LGDRTLVILADNAAPERFHVNKVWLNDRLLDRWWLRHAEIAAGGVLRFEMSD